MAFGQMILTVTLNAAVDVTYEVDDVVLDSSHRVTAPSRRAGGKGINVARVLHELGLRARITGLVGGRTGETIREDLGRSGLSDSLLTIDADSRQTVTLVSRMSGSATVFNEAGPSVRRDEWTAFFAHFSDLLPLSSVVVLAGSLPPGVPGDAYALLARRARDAGVPVILDADGEALRLGVSERPAIVKPNTHELRAAIDDRPDSQADLSTLHDSLAAARQLCDDGAEAVVVSLGAAGLLACTPSGTWRAAPPARLQGNPAGAGDAVVAALALGLADGEPWPRRLAKAVALSAAAVLAPVAGSVDLSAYRKFLPAVELEVI